MINKLFLDKLLKSGAELTGSGKSTSHAQQDITQTLGSLLKGKGGAAVAGGALGYLLGSKKGRSVGGKVLTYGGLAALGALAYKAYGDWQQNQQVAGQPTTSPVPQTLGNMNEQQAEQHCKAILIAVIAAAKADGHIDDREREIIDAEVAKLTADAMLIRFVDTELQKPLDPAEVSKHAKNQEMAAEMFLASVLVIDQESFMERSYLNELARQLALPEGLQHELKQQVKNLALTAQN